MQGPGAGTDRRRLLLGALLLLAFALRVGWIVTADVVDPGRSIMGDSATYSDPARALLEDGRYVWEPGSDRTEYLRTPGYPVFLAGVYAVNGQSDLVALLVQAALGTLTVFVVSLIGARLWSFTVGLAAAALVALQPLQVAYSGIVSTETLAALFLTVGALLLVRLVGATSRRPGWAALAGLAFCAATFVRPATYYLPLVLAIALVVWAGRAIGWRRGLATVTAFLLAYGVPVAAWQVRNLITVDTWRFSAVEGKNLYIFRGGEVVAAEEGISSAAAQARLRASLGPRESYEHDGAYYDEMWRRGSEIAREHPLDLLGQTPRGLLSVLFVTSRSSDTAQFFGVGQAPVVVHVLLNLALAAFYACAVAGAVTALRRRTSRAEHVLLLLIAGYVLLVSAGPEAWQPPGRGMRLRAPVMPILSLYAAAGLLVVRRGVTAALRSR